MAYILSRMQCAYKKEIRGSVGVLVSHRLDRSLIQRCKTLATTIVGDTDLFGAHTIGLDHILFC